MVMSHPTASGAESPALRDALAAVLDGMPVPIEVPDAITASWHRSAASGLDPARLVVPEVSDVDLEGQLVQAAAPVLDQLAADVGTSEAAFVLAAPGGEVLDRRVSESSLMRELDHVLLTPGFAYPEESVGTNGIGTTLAQGSPGFVRGDEHFASALTGFACAAAPIRNPASGQVVGAIDLTTFAADANTLMLPFVRQAAREIEHRLVDLTGVAERIMLHRFLQERKRAKGPIVLMTSNRMVANAAASRLVGEADGTVLWEAAKRATNGGGHSSPATVELASGRVITVRTEELMDGGTPVGMLIRLGEVAESTASGRLCPRPDRAAFGWDALTATERSVVDLVAQGLTNKEAAERMLLSRHTVGFHLRSIFRKLDVASRVELTRLFVQRRH